MDTFHNKVAVVTGAASGIGLGLGLARALAGEGAKVAMVDKRQDVLATAAADVAREGGRVIHVTLDVTHRGGWAAAADRVESELFGSTATVRPARRAATGSLPLLPPGVSREETPIFITAPDGDEVAKQVLEGIRRNRLYILTHAEIRPVLEARSAALVAALPAGPVNPARIEASSRLLDVSLYAN